MSKLFNGVGITYNNHTLMGVSEMSVETYINFNGNCREAVEYYAEVFGTEKPQLML